MEKDPGTRTLSMNMDEYLPLREVVFNTLRQAILAGELRPGERLMEIHLAERLGVSRTPIREAIRKLTAEGLVSMVPRKGATVAQITEKNLRDVLEVRRNLDTFAVELACERITEAQIQELENKIIFFEQATKEKNVKEIAEADVELHNFIVRVTGNDRLAELVKNLSEQVYRYRFEYIKDETTHNILVKEHREIYECMKKRNAACAKEAMRRHITNQENGIIKHLCKERET
jgi:DNA-binding GntR family transcriptional regulator